jgi:hypothetical protein
VNTARKMLMGGIDSKFGGGNADCWRQNVRHGIGVLFELK